MTIDLPKQYLIGLDLGHSSIGWAIAEEGQFPNLLGTGVVLFPADDCLAFKRRAYRRQRRHVRATRLRIERLKRFLAVRGSLTREELDRPGSAFPWKLAARVYKGGSLLTWSELWDVLRWYAHNRGYDGNKAWSRIEGLENASSETEKEDTEKLQNARDLLTRHGTTTMAETLCAALEIDPLGTQTASSKNFKRLNAAFDRTIVEKEVRRLLEKHSSLPGCDALLTQALFGP